MIPIGTLCIAIKGATNPDWNKYVAGNIVEIISNNIRNPIYPLHIYECTIPKSVPAAIHLYSTGSCLIPISNPGLDEEIKKEIPFDRLDKSREKRKEFFKEYAVPRWKK